MDKECRAIVLLVNPFVLSPGVMLWVIALVVSAYVQAALCSVYCTSCYVHAHIRALAGAFVQDPKLKWSHYTRLEELENVVKLQSTSTAQSHSFPKTLNSHLMTYLETRKATSFNAVVRWLNKTRRLSVGFPQMVFRIISLKIPLTSLLLKSQMPYLSFSISCNYWTCAFMAGSAVWKL